MNTTDLTFNDLPKVEANSARESQEWKIYLGTLLTAKANQKRICMYL